MSRFLFASWGFDSHLDTFLAVGNALRRHGHEVAIYTSPDQSASVESIGAQLFPFEELSQERANEIIEAVIENRRRPWKLWQFWRQFLIDTIPAQVNDLQRVLDDYSPDVLVSEVALWGPMAVLRETINIPVVILSHIGFCLQPGEQFGPVPGRAMPPRRTARQQLAARAMGAFSGFAARDARQRVNAFRASYGLRPLEVKMTELCGMMDGYLIPSCPSFDYNRTDLPWSVRYVGPCLFPAPARSASAASDTALRRVVVDEGALYAQEPVMIRSAIAGLSAYSVTALSGKGRSVTDLPAESGMSDASILPWRPVQQALNGAAILVTNGNTESVMAGLSQGVPMVVVPSIMDQVEVALRVHECGAGLMLPERECTPDTLRSAVDTVLANRSFRACAERMARELNSQDGPRAAARYLEELTALRETETLVGAR